MGATELTDVVAELSADRVALHVSGPFDHVLRHYAPVFRAHVVRKEFLE